MKNLILVLLFIPFISFSQSKKDITFNDIMKIDSEDKFTKLMFDRRYSSIQSESEQFNYALNPDEDNKSMAFASYFQGTDIFYFQFVIPPQNLEDIGYLKNYYENILEKAENKCEFVKMQKIERTSYACYDCKQAKFEGYLGFAIVNGFGNIAQIRYTD